MPVNPSDKPYALKDKTELAVEQFASLENPTQADLNMVYVTAQVQFGIEAYRAKAKDMSIMELEAEQHDSAKMAQHLTECGEPRPNQHCHAHAIIAGKHPDAAKLRAVMAWVKMRIDDAHNGCWLPRNTEAKKHMPARLQNAVPHSRIHRYNYYFWLGNRINLRLTPNTETLAQTLSLVAASLQQSTFPPFVMKRKGEGVE